MHWDHLLIMPVTVHQQTITFSDLLHMEHRYVMLCYVMQKLFALFEDVVNIQGQS